MKGIKRMALGTAVAAFLAVAGLLLASQAFAASGSAQIGSGSAAPGADGIVDLSALGITSPGLGAWTVDIVYDPSVVTATACSAAQGGVCNEAFANDTVRITGAVAEGLEGDSVLGTITFECGDAVGESPLEVSLFTFADGTLGGPLPIDAETVNGTFACATAATPTPTLATGGIAGTGTGTAGDSTGMTWIIVGLAALGLTSMAAFGTLRLRERA